MNREQILAVYHQGPEAVVQLVTKLCRQMDQIQARVEQLEARTKKNSANSHLPPSSDWAPSRPSSSRETSERHPGGQPGHPGRTLKPVENPDYVVIHRVTSCNGCGASLESISARRTVKSQVFDLPPLSLEVTQHEAEVKSCPHCGRLQQAEFPEHVTHHVQYGPRIRAFIVYLNAAQLLPSRRLMEMFRQCFGCTISEGTIQTIIQESAALLADLEEPIKEKLLASPILHTDETSLSVKGKRQWVHVASTPETTWLACHPKRGREAMEAIGLLSRYEGTMIHDAWKPYFSFTQADHALYNAHLLRDLRSLHELHHQGWAKRMIGLLLEMNRIVEQAGGALTDAQACVLEQAFDYLLREAELWDVLLLPHGSEVASRETGKLLCRLRERRTEILRFLREPPVPFDNNLAERDLRMAKTKEKISGTFRSDEGVHGFCLMRIVISTIQKQNKPIGETLETVVSRTLRRLVFPKLMPLTRGFSPPKNLSLSWASK